MIKLGEVKKDKQWERISFKEWISKGYARAGTYSIRVIFPPARYSTFTVIFEDSENRMEVRINIKTEKMKEALKALGLVLKKSDLPALYFEVEGDESGLMYGLNLDPRHLRLCWRGTYWVRRWQEEEPQDLDIEL